MLISPFTDAALDAADESAKQHKNKDISENQLNTVGKKPLIVEVTAAIGSTNS